MAVVAVMVPGLLVGCATMTGGTSGDIARSMSDVASAASAAELAFDLDHRDLSTSAATSTTLDDMLDEILTAQTAVSELDVRTADEKRLLAEATESIRACIDAINEARQSLSGTESTGASALDALEATADDAARLSDELEQYR